MDLTCCSVEPCKDDCPDLTQRESVVCTLICSANPSVSFSELKQATSLHQEILSRILHRLAVHGVVEKMDGGYRRRISQ